MLHNWWRHCINFQAARVCTHQLPFIIIIRVGLLKILQSTCTFLMQAVLNFGFVTSTQSVLLSRRSRQRQRLRATALSICSFVCLSVDKMQKRDFFSKTKQFRAMVSTDDLQEVVHGLFKEPIIGPLKSKIAQIRHLENRHDVLFSAEVVRFG